MSARLGMVFHQSNEMVEQRRGIVRAGARLGVALEAEGRPVPVGDALQAAVEQRHMGWAQVFGQAFAIDGEAVVLARDQHRAVIEIAHRMIGAMVAVGHLHAAGAAGEAEQLVAKANAEQGNAGVDKRAGGFDGVGAGFRVAGAIGEEDAVGRHRQHLPRRRGGGNHGHSAAARGKQAQDVALDAEIIGGDAIAPAIGPGRRVSVSRPQGPGASGPWVAFRGADFLRQIHSLEAGKGPGFGERALRPARRVFGAGKQAAVERAFFPQQAGQPPGVDFGDGDDVLRFEEFVEVLLAAEVARQQGQVADNEPGGPGPA